MDLQIELEKGDLRVKIFNAQPVSLTYKGIEHVHGGGKPEEAKTPEDRKGWQRSDNTMFPVVGPVRFGGYAVRVGDIVIPQDQHGIAGSIPFHPISIGSCDASFVQTHDGKSKITNPRHKSGTEARPQHLEWPFTYTLEKTVRLEEDRVVVTYTLKNESGEEMPYMLGAHPAFKTGGDAKDGVFEVNGREHSLEEVVKTSKEIGALLIEKADSVKYTNRRTARGVEVSSENFGNVMIWSPGEDAGMFCIEPVTQLPVLNASQSYFTIGDHEKLGPSCSAVYAYTIIPSMGKTT